MSFLCLTLFIYCAIVVVVAIVDDDDDVVVVNDTDDDGDFAKCSQQLAILVYSRDVFKLRISENLD